MEVPHKVCKCCGVDKPLYEYGRNKAAFDCLQSQCVECLRRKHKPSELETIRKNTDFVNWWELR